MWNKLKSVFRKRESALSKSVGILVKHLKDDPELYYAWQANIAMQFEDECSRKKIYGRVKLHEAANTAAKNFLDLLIRDNNE